MADDEEGSDHQDSMPGPPRRRTRRRVVMKLQYSDTSSENSDGEAAEAVVVPQPGENAMQTVKPASEHSEWEEDWQSDSEMGVAGPSSATCTPAKKKKTTTLDDDGHSSDSSTSSNGRDKCPICLFSFTDQEVGKPETCDHKFCAICIEEWSKNVSTCPIDRREFLKIVCLQDYHTPTVTREIAVEVTKKCDSLLATDEGDEDLTFCRVCTRADREESMLLCDGCNQGYHMECLVPPLTEIPTEFWYCDDCFASNDDDDPDDALALQEEIAELMDEVREFGIPETRLRIRTETAPRILRTRQSERIRDAILARTNRRGFREATREVPEQDVVAMPGPSRMQTTVRMGRTRSSTGAATRRTTTRRRRATRRTVVLEYDVDNENDKFAVKTTKKIIKKIKKRRKKKKKTPSRATRLRCTRSSNDASLTGAELSQQMSSVNRLDLCNDPSKDALTLTRSRAGIPRLRITGGVNDLDYYSSDDGEDLEHAVSGGGAAGGLLMGLRHPRIGGNIRSLRSGKAGLVIPESAMASSADVLGSIMSEQERWLTISNPKNIKNIKIKPDGRLEYEGDRVTKNSGRVVVNGQSRMPVRGAAAGTATAEVPVTNSNASESNSGGGGGGSGSATGTVENNGGEASVNRGEGVSTATANGGGSAGGSFPDFRTAAARKAPPDGQVVLGEEKDSKKKPPVEDSSDEDCPNFSVYSAETMQLAKNISNPTGEENNSEIVGVAAEEEPLEDLVQLDDDEIEGERSEAVEVKANSEDALAKGGKKCELELHDDSDWDELHENQPKEEEEAEEKKNEEGGNDEKDSAAPDQLNTESISEDDEEILVNDNSRRSLTPCLDEKPPEDQQEVNNNNNNNEDKEEEEKDLELISDEDIGDQQNASNSKRSGENVDEFKRLSRTTKVRNYRDKDRRSQSPKGRSEKKSRRSESPSGGHRSHNSSSNSRSKRKDLARYDVRNVIAERKQRPDKYGRDTTKQKPRSKSRSSSLSSLSPDEAQHQRRSRSHSRRRRTRSRTRSPRRRKSRSPVGRRGRSPRRASPVANNRSRRSLSRFTISPSVSRSPSPAPRSPRGRLGPRRERHAASPKRMRNGRGGGGGGEGRKNERSPSPRRNHTTEAQNNRRRRRSRSDSSSSSSSESPSPVRVAKGKSRYPPEDADQAGKSWTPPLRAEDRLLGNTAGNFKVTVKNSGSGNSGNKDRKEKKEKKKKRSEKKSSKESDREKRKEKKKAKSKATLSTSKSTSAGPSKEVFTSGDNILVSVNFSSKRTGETGAQPQQTTIVTLPASKDQIVTQKQRQERRRERERERAQVVEVRSSKSSGKRGVSPNRENLVVTKNKRHRKVDAKPVAIIDLDGSPFRVMTPSPKAVIVLSDSEGESGDKRKRAKKTSGQGGGGAAEEATAKKLQHSTGSGGAQKSNSEATKRKAPPPVSVTVTETLRVNSDDDDVDMEIVEKPVPAQPQPQTHNNARETDSGPKTPPLPPSMKFSMSMRSKSAVLRQVNPLHDAREEEEEQQEQQQQQQEKQKQSESVVPVEKENITTEEDKSTQGTSVADQSVNATNGGVTGGATGTGSASRAGSSNKIGPNTPPEPAPTSPDAYDPFEPTKSNSVSPARDDMDLDMHSSHDEAPPVKIVTSPRHKDLRTLDEHKGKIPVKDLVMKLLNSTAQHHHHLHQSQHHLGDIGTLSPPPPPPPYLEKSLERGSGGDSKGITILSNVMIQPGKAPGESGPSGKSLKHTAAFSTMNSTTTSYSIMKQMQTEAKRMLYAKQKAAPPSVTTSTATTCTPTLTQAMLKKHNAECTLMDMAAESPYSPGSGDFEDLFEPPMDVGSRIPQPSPLKAAVGGGGGGGVMPKSQADLFDNLFGSHSPPTAGAKWTPSKLRKSTTSGSRGHSQNMSSNRRSHHSRSSELKGREKSGGEGEVNLVVFVAEHSSLDDDVPDSAVDLVLKENYIQKLNRQERVIEEVKLVLKPHFLRKYITKEDYKEIMKKSVSKICNSRSGEINPQKIKAFIDAYVKKYRYRRKHGSSSTGAGASGAVTGTTTTASNAMSLTAAVGTSVASQK